MAAAPTFSIVVPSLNEGAMLHMTTESIERHTGDLPYEVLIVDDGSTDGSTASYPRGSGHRVRVVPGGGLGVARARNLGARQARGDYVVFMDAHCRVSAGWLEGLAEVLSSGDVGMVGPSFTKLESPTPRGCGMRWSDHTLDPCWFEPEGDEVYLVPLTTGACQAFRRDVFDWLGGYDSAFTRWGYEDVEMCLRAWLLGLRVAAHPGITVAHYFREARDNYEVDDLDVTYNFLQLAYLHFSATRIQRVLRTMEANPYVVAAQERLANSDIFERRDRMLSRRAYDDEWFFQQVNGPLG
jgi:glycosyltransferase involved in cell wall biosynthesis